MSPDDIEAIRGRFNRSLRIGRTETVALFAAYDAITLDRDNWMGAQLAALDTITELRQRIAQSGEFVQSLDRDRKRFAERTADAERQVEVLIHERNMARYAATEWRNKAADGDEHCDRDSYRQAHPFTWEATS